jgi:malonyl CoA-acyl carrier protein transacylase
MTTTEGRQVVSENRCGDMLNRVRFVGFFPGLGSRAAYTDADRSLLKCAFPAVRRIYIDAAESLGCNPLDFFSLPKSLTPLERLGLIGAAVLVQSLALSEHLKAAANRAEIDLDVAAYTGESFGIITSAVAAGSLSCRDGAKIANIFTPLMMLAANGQGIGEPIAQRNMTHLVELLQGERLVAEPSHVVALNGDAVRLQDALCEILKFYSRSDVEVHKLYSSRQTNVYVRAGAMASFNKFMKNYPGVSVRELKSPTTFLAHSERMHRVRLALDRYMEENGILFRDPIAPLVSNERPALIATADEVRDAVLAITDRVMASMYTIRVIVALEPDYIFELGYGNKSVQLIVDNDVSIPVSSYTGTSPEAIGLLNSLKEARSVRRAADASHERGLDIG